MCLGWQYICHPSIYLRLYNPQSCIQASFKVRIFVVSIHRCLGEFFSANCIRHYNSEPFGNIGSVMVSINPATL